MKLYYLLAFYFLEDLAATSHLSPREIPASGLTYRCLYPSQDEDSTSVAHTKLTERLELFRRYDSSIHIFQRAVTGTEEFLQGKAEEQTSNQNERHKRASPVRKNNSFLPSTRDDVLSTLKRSSSNSEKYHLGTITREDALSTLKRSSPESEKYHLPTSSIQFPKKNAKLAASQHGSKTRLSTSLGASSLLSIRPKRRSTFNSNHLLSFKNRGSSLAEVYDHARKEDDDEIRPVITLESPEKENTLSRSSRKCPNKSNFNISKGGPTGGRRMKSAELDLLEQGLFGIPKGTQPGNQGRVSKEDRPPTKTQKVSQEPSMWEMTGKVVKNPRTAFGAAESAGTIASSSGALAWDPRLFWVGKNSVTVGWNSVP